MLPFASRLSEIADAAGEWVRGEVDLARAEARGAVVRLMIVCGAGLLGLAALIGLLVGAAMLLAPVVGAPFAVLGVSGLTLLAAASALVACRPGLRGPARDEARARVDRAEARLAALVPGEPDPRNGSSQPNGTTSRHADSPLQDPAILTSAGFAALSVLGPRRSLALATRGAAAVSAVSALTKAYQQGRATHSADLARPTRAETNRPPDTGD